MRIKHPAHSSDSKPAPSPASVANQIERLGYRERLSEVVAGKIKAYIMRNQLRAGDRLPTEQDFADMFGVSKLSIREATKALTFIGIIEAAPRRGLSVGRIDMHRVTEYLGFHFAINDYPKEQLLKTRLVIETGALPETIDRFAHDQTIFARLMSTVEQHAKVRDLAEYIQYDVAFHRALLEASGIEPLLAFNDLLVVFFDRFRKSVLSMQNDWSRGVDDHRRILITLRDGDLQRATLLLKRHLEPYRQYLADDH